MAGQPGSVADNRAKKTRGERGARGQCCRWCVSEREGMQDVGSSPGFQAIKHAQIYVVRQLAYSTELLVCINQA